MSATKAFLRAALAMIEACQCWPSRQDSPPCPIEREEQTSTTSARREFVRLKPYSEL